MKSVEKKDGDGAHNWGNPTEIPDDNPTADDAAAADGTGGETSAPKDWAQQVDEAEKQMTLDEYKKQLEAKKRAQQEKVPLFKTRTANEGEDPKVFKELGEAYRKKNADGASEGEDAESDAEEVGSDDEDADEGQTIGKKKVISIPLRFKPIEVPRGPAGSFGPRGGGGQRRGGGGGRYQERTNRDEQGTANTPNPRPTPASQPNSDYQNDEYPQPSYRGGARGGGSFRGAGRGENRRPYGNSARGSRGGYNRSGADPNAPDLDNALDFPTLPKQ